MREDSFWQTPGSRIVHAPRYEGAKPSFYPLYRSGDCWSPSLLDLILTTKQFVYHPGYWTPVTAQGAPFVPSDHPIAEGIERVGAPLTSTRDAYTNPQRLAEAIAEALHTDMRAVEDANPEARNVILVGGKDSLNLLLLPWKHPTVAYSAMPNFPLVQAFVEENGLAIEVRELSDETSPEQLAEEKMEACLRADLSHWRWGGHLMRLAEQSDAPLVFWKGQLADVFMTDFWKTYLCQPSKAYSVYRKVARRVTRLLPPPIDAMISGPMVQSTFDMAYRRGAAMQGVHVAYLRALCGNQLFLSAYHGPAVIDVMSRVDYPRAVRRDIRPLVGATLLGREVRYPTSNPAPAPSTQRHGAVDPDGFFAALQAVGVDVRAAS